MNSNINPVSLESGADESAEVQLRELDEYRAVLERGERVTPEVWIERRPEAHPALAALRGQFCLFEAKRLQPNAFGLETPPSSPDSTLPYAEAPTTHKPEIPGHDLLEECGRGGMGVVFKARHLKLDRLVAVKVIRAGLMADEDAVRRFYTEAQAVAKLQHPNIVAIHDVGEHDGHHYFSMDYIDGASLADVIRTSPLPGKTAAHYIQIVAEAVHFAHQNGIFHRDLKPSNILLQSDSTGANRGNRESGSRLRSLDKGLEDENSESPPLSLFPPVQNLVPKITDFGLAKRLEGGPDLTSAGHALGTPSYMPPEQASGEHATVGPWNDVYSLGATLYALVTGRPPFQAASAVETLRQVIEQEPVAPRQLNPAIDRDLETITLKCLQKEPAKRYGSAYELATDLGRYLRDEPILARPISAPERLWRWCRRNPRTALLSAAVVLLLVGFAATSTVIALQQRAQRLFAEKTAETERELRQQADDATTLAQQNAETSREQSQLALQSLGFVIFDIQRGLRNVPGAGAVQRKLIQHAIDRLQKVSDQYAARSAIDRTTHVALIDLGDLLLRIGSDPASLLSPSAGRGARGEGESSAPGPLAAARKVYEQAMDIAQRLAAADPTDAQAQRDLSVSYERLGIVQVQSGQVADALRSCEKNLEIRQKLAAAHPIDAQTQRDLCVSFNKLGDVQRQIGQVPEALRSYENGLKISQKLAADPTDAQAQRDLSVSYERLGYVQFQTGQVSEALRSFEKLLAISQKLAAADPTNAQAQRDLSISFEKLGDVQLQSRQVTEALESYEKALEISQKLAAADPTDARAQRDLSISFEKLGDVQLQSGQVTEALRSYEKDLEISQKLAAADPTNAQVQRHLSITFERLGNVQLQSGHVTAALESHEKALEIRLKLAAADPSDAQAQRDLSHSYYDLGEAERAAKQYERAIAWYEKAAEQVNAMQQAGRLAPQDKNVLTMLERRIQQCRHATTALGDWKTLLEQPPKLLPVLLEIRGTESVQVGRIADAVQAVAKLRELGTATAEQLYNAACVYSLSAASVAKGKPELSADDQALRARYADEAVATLRQAIAAGWKDFAHIKKDPGLNAIRDRDDFKKLMAEVELK